MHAKQWKRGKIFTVKAPGGNIKWTNVPIRFITLGRFQNLHRLISPWHKAQTFRWTFKRIFNSGSFKTTQKTPYMMGGAFISKPEVDWAVLVVCPLYSYKTLILKSCKWHCGYLSLCLIFSPVYVYWCIAPSTLWNSNLQFSYIPLSIIKLHRIYPWCKGNN